MSLHALIVGAAAGGGLPQWNCNGPNSATFWRGDAPLVPASQSSLAISGDGESWALLNASPDIRQQIMSRPQLQPRDPARHGLRDTPISTVLLTNGDIDHIAGLLILREKQAFNLFATQTVAQPPLGIGVGSGGLKIAIKNMRQVIGMDPRPIVTNLDVYLFTFFENG